MKLLQKLIIFTLITIIMTGYVSAWSAKYSTSEMGIYYGTDAKVARKLFNKKINIIQDYNFSLFRGYTGKKICYLSVWESTEDQAILSTLWLDALIIGKNADWWGYIMNMSDEKWQNYLVQKAQNLKNLWCNGLFIDTIWQSDQQSGWIEIIKKLRINWTNAFIIVNNAHEIKETIAENVNGYMFENFWQYWTTKWSTDGNWYVALFGEYLKLWQSWKTLYAISYSDPSTYKTKALKTWWMELSSLAKLYHFSTIYASKDLDNIY